MHIPEYMGQEEGRFLKTKFKMTSLEQFKKNTQIYDMLNDGVSSYVIMLDKISRKDNIVKNIYTVKKQNYDISIKRTEVNMDFLARRGSNINEFFDIINW